MFILLISFITTKVLEVARMYGPSVVKYAMVCGIMIAGIVMLFGAVGMKISTHLGSTLANGAFRAIGSIFRAFGRFLRWFVGIIPRIFRWLHNWLTSLGMVPWLATLIAVIITVIII